MTERAILENFGSCYYGYRWLFGIASWWGCLSIYPDCIQFDTILIHRTIQLHEVDYIDLVCIFPKSYRLTIHFKDEKKIASITMGRKKRDQALVALRTQGVPVIEGKAWWKFKSLH